MKTLIIIPAYNEEATILSTVGVLRRDNYDFIVVNDGSGDSTADICYRNDIPLLDLAYNLGIGGAVQAGYIYANEMGYDIAIQFDADGQHDAKTIPSLINAISNGADLVIGSRFIEYSETNFKSTGLRRIGIKWLSGLIKATTGQRIYDVTSGFRAAGKRAIKLFCENYPQDYPEPESIVIAIKHHLSVDEIPAEMHERQGGASSIRTLSSVYYMIKVTLAIFIQGLSRFHVN